MTSESRGFYRGKSGPEPKPFNIVTLPTDVPLVDARQVARLQGFTGDFCSNCGGLHVQVDGHCSVCRDCGTTTGCS